MIRGVVIYTFGIEFIHVIIFETCVFIVSSFQHSNIKINKTVEKALSKIIVTPSIHFVHHEKEVSNTNSNYGTIFSFWDRIFKSFNQSIKRTNDMDIGIKHYKSGKFEEDKSLINLIKAPLNKD